MTPHQSGFNAETLFRYNGWTIRAFVDNEGVKEVFWGDHEPCDSSIQGIPGERFCDRCGANMDTESENVLADALRMLRDSLVVRIPTLSEVIEKGFIYGVSKSTFPIRGK